jgi:hypothetical protein
MGESLIPNLLCREWRAVKTADRSVESEVRDHAAAT